MRLYKFDGGGNSPTIDNTDGSLEYERYVDSTATLDVRFRNIAYPKQSGSPGGGAGTTMLYSGCDTTMRKESECAVLVYSHGRWMRINLCNVVGHAHSDCSVLVLFSTQADAVQARIWREGNNTNEIRTSDSN